MHPNFAAELCPACVSGVPVNPQIIWCQCALNAEGGFLLLLLYNRAPCASMVVAECC